MVVVMVFDRIKTSWVFLGGSALLILGGSVHINEYVSGVSNPAILSVFILIIITAGVNDHFNLAGFFESLFGKTGNQRSFIWRMGLSVSAISSVMNNTPVVAMMMPYVYQWGQKHNINPSKLLLPLSYSAILGGVITLIGTSTNLVLNGLLLENGAAPLGFTDFLIPGVLITLGCLLFMFAFGSWLMPDKNTTKKSLTEEVREYLVETRVTAKSGWEGKTVEKAGLRQLESVFLTEINRGKIRLAPVKPTDTLMDGDVLIFAGETAVTLAFINKTKELELSKTSQFELADGTEIIEAIVLQNSGLDRRTVKQIGFREKYDAAIVGIHRLGEKIGGKIGSVHLRTGDLLLINAGAEFRERASRTNDLLIVNSLKSRKELANWKLLLFITSVLLTAGLLFAGVMDLLAGLLFILAVQLLLSMTNVERIKKNISFELLSILISALALGKALISTGAADYLSHVVFANAHTWDPMWVLGGVFASTFVLTSLITNVAAISIIFPVVFSLTTLNIIPAQALYLTAAFGASCCFATPFAYQTNLMVMEAGNYNFKDFMRLGLPLSVVYAFIFLTFVAFKYSLL